MSDNIRPSIKLAAHRIWCKTCKDIYTTEIYGDLSVVNVEEIRCPEFIRLNTLVNNNKSIS